MTSLHIDTLIVTEWSPRRMAASARASGVVRLERTSVQGFQKGPIFPKQGSSGSPSAMGPRALAHPIASPLARTDDYSQKNFAVYTCSCTRLEWKFALSTDVLKKLLYAKRNNFLVCASRKRRL